MEKRGIFFSVDALIALIIIFLTILIVYPNIEFPYTETSIPQDLVLILSSLKIGDFNNNYSKQLISQGLVEDVNKSLIEQIGIFYVTNISIAKNLAENILLDLNYNGNLGIWYGEDLLASINSTSFENSDEIEVERQLISGIEKGKNLTGFVARAWLKKIAEKKNTLLVKGDFMCGKWRVQSSGYYCTSSKNKITYEVNVPINADIVDAWFLFEGTHTGQPTNIFVNGNEVFDSTIQYYEIINITSYINNGENLVFVDTSPGGDDGASHIVVNYKVTDIQTYVHQIIFPFHTLETNSVLHYEKSIIVPTAISSINLTINTSEEVTLNFKVGSQEVFIGKKYPVNDEVLFTDSEIINKLSEIGISYSDLANEYFFFIVQIGEDQPNKDVFIGKNSYVTIISEEIVADFGAIDISKEIPITSATNLLFSSSNFYRNLVWSFYLPTNSLPILADWQLGWISSSGGGSSQEVGANGINLYNSPPDPYIPAFSRFGYTPTKANRVFVDEENNFTIDLGNSYGISNESSYGLLTYFIKSFVNYGDTKEKTVGGSRTIIFEDDTNLIISIGDPNDIWDPEDDALDDAVERLLVKLDTNNNGKIDIIIDQESFEIESLDISGVPSLWSTESQVRVWKS